MKRFRLFIVTVLILICILYICLQTFYQQQSVLSSKISLNNLRDNIAWYKEQLDRYPDKLIDIPDYVEKVGLERWNLKLNGEYVGLYSPNSCFEYISKSKGDNTVYTTLNNLGGFYYNNETGEVRINLKEPLKNYFFIYFHPNGDEVPVNW